MSRYTALVPVLVLSVMSLATGCGGSDETRTTTSAGAAPTVSGATPEVTTEEPAVARTVSYAAAESAFGKARYPEAVELFTSYVGANPENAWGHYMLGMSAWRTGEHEKAIESFDKALQLDPSHRKSLFNSGRVLLEAGRAKDALERIQKGLELEPMSNEGLRLLGRTRYELAQVDEAIKAYQRALTLDENDVWSMNNLGLIYIQQGRSAEAIPSLARAVELRGNSPVFQNNLATALEKSGYPTAAAKAYEGALAAESAYSKAAVGLARVTGGGQQPESTTVDLTALSQGFQEQIECWRGVASSTDSSTVSVVPAVDSTGAVQTTADSALVSGGEVSDTTEECDL
jgi:predicted Zn-dependent protease